MHKIIRPFTGVLMLAGGLWLGMAALRPAAARAQQPVDQIIASVDGEPITMHDLKEFSAANGVNLSGANDPKSAALKREALKGLITQKLMEQELKNFHGRVDDATIDNYIQRIAEKNHMSESEFRGELERQGVAFDAYRKQVRNEIEKAQLIDSEVREKVNVTAEQIEQYYKNNAKEFSITTERLKLAQILVAVDPKSPPAKVDAARAKAEMIRKKALAGEDFGKLAREYSEDDSKSNGGELGYFKPDDILDQIKVAVIKLQTGQISDLVETRHGFHIVKVEVHERPGVKPLAEVKDEIRDKLSQQGMEAQFRRWINEELVKNHHVESFL